MNAYIQRLGTRSRDVDRSVAESPEERLEADFRGTSDISEFRYTSKQDRFVILSAVEEEEWLATEVSGMESNSGGESTGVKYMLYEFIK